MHLKIIAYSVISMMLSFFAIVYKYLPDENSENVWTFILASSIVLFLYASFSLMMLFVTDHCLKEINKRQEDEHVEHS